MSERLRYEHAERIRDFYREQGAGKERERIIKLLEDSFYPLDYGRWQADELMEEIFRLLGKVDDVV
jgi:hypothetical protein